MKYLLLFCIPILTSCSELASQKADYSIENKAYNCIENKAQESGVSLSDSINLIEKILIEKSVLSSDVNTSYDKFFKECSKGNILKGDLKYDDLVRFSSILFLATSPECDFANDEKLRQDYPDSKLVLLKDSADYYGNNGEMEKMNGLMGRVLTVKDYQNPYYRTVACQMIILITNQMFNESEAQITILPKKAKKEYSKAIEPGNILKVFANSKDEIYINGVRSSVDSVYGKVIQFYGSHKEAGEGLVKRKKVILKVEKRMLELLTERKNNALINDNHQEVKTLEEEMAKLEFKIKIIEEIGEYYELQEEDFIVFSSEKKDFLRQIHCNTR